MGLDTLSLGLNTPPSDVNVLFQDRKPEPYTSPLLVLACKAIDDDSSSSSHSECLQRGKHSPNAVASLPQLSYLS